MKVGPSPGLIPPPRSGGMGVAPQPTVLFEDLLDHRALGFSEASLLGGDRAVSSPALPAETDASTDPATAEAAALAATGRLPVEQLPTPADAAAATVATAVIGAPAPPVADQAIQAARTAISATPSPTRALITRALGAALREELAGTSSEPNPATRLVPAPDHRKTEPPAAQVAVAVSEVEGRLQVVAAAPGLNPEASARVRRIVADLAARFGLNLGDLHLNGVRLTSSIPGQTGAPHGG